MHAGRVGKAGQTRAGLLDVYSPFGVHYAVYITLLPTPYGIELCHMSEIREMSVAIAIPMRSCDRWARVVGIN